MLLGSINKNPCHIFEGSLLFGLEYVVRVTQFRRAVTFTGLSHQKNVAHVPHAEGKHYSSLFSSICLRFFVRLCSSLSLSFSCLSRLSPSLIFSEDDIRFGHPPFFLSLFTPCMYFCSTWIDSFSSHWFRINPDVHSADNMLHSVLKSYTSPPLSLSFSFPLGLIKE